MLGAERIELSAEAVGGSIRSHGWTLKTDPAARLVWPIYPYNPYANGPEKNLEYAVGLLSIPVRARKMEEEEYIRPAEQEIPVSLEVE